MNFDDEDKGFLPTRTGEAQGHTFESRLLGNAGGSASFVTRIRIQEALGEKKTTMLRTKDGMPRFQTTVERSYPENEEPLRSYMETGELKWLPGFEPPRRYESGTWHLHNVELNDPMGKPSKWLGRVDASGKQTKRQPTPADTGVLRDQIDSLAIGYPRQLNQAGNIDATSDALVLDSYGVATSMKKLVTEWFPPEIFTGKLRKFIQAQYGAKESKGYWPYQIEILGESALLQYQREEGRRIQFYFWPHATTGLFTAPDYRYYLFELTSSERAGYMRITGMPILLSKFGKAVRKKILSGKISDSVEIEKAEAYMFADATIDTGNSFTVGEFSVAGSLGSIAWGWKFNSTGERINIVSTWMVGEAVANSLDGRAAEHHVVVSRSDIFDGDESGKWSVSVESFGTYNWQDGWGEFNILVPDSETSTLLTAYSHRITWGTVAEYAYTGVPVYGFFDKNDVWTTVKLSKTLPVGTRYEQEAEGVMVSPGLAGESDLASPPAQPWKETSIRESTTPEAFVEQRTVYSRKAMDVAVGGWSFQGKTKTGSFYREAEKLSGGAGTFTTESELYDGPMVGPLYAWAPVPGEYAAVTDAQALPNWLRTTGTDERVPITFYRWGGDFYYAKVWSLVIPAGDCESVHVATHEYRNDTYTSSIEAPYESWGAAERWVRYYTIANGHWHTYFYCPTRWVAFGYTRSTLTWSNTGYLPTHQSTTGVYAWSRTLSGEQGTPSTSYATLFGVDRSYPFFNGTIRFKESYGGKYHGTEGYNSGGVFQNSLFVGWY